MTTTKMQLRNEYRRIRSQCSSFCSSREFDLRAEMALREFGCSRDAEGYVMAAEMVMFDFVTAEELMLEKNGAR